MKKLLGAIAGLALTGMATTASAETILFQSIPDLTAVPEFIICSGCGDPYYRTFDVFTLSAHSSIDNILFNLSGEMGSILYPLDSFNLSIWSISDTLPSEPRVPGDEGNPGPESLGLPGTMLLGQDFSSGSYSVANNGNPPGTKTISVNPLAWALLPGTYYISFFDPEEYFFLAAYCTPGDAPTSGCTGVSGVLYQQGYGWDQGRAAGFVLNGSELPPVPIPAALPLFAAGLGAMGFMGWRRRKAAVAG